MRQMIEIQIEKHFRAQKSDAKGAILQKGCASRGIPDQSRKKEGVGPDGEAGKNARRSAASRRSAPEKPDEKGGGELGDGREGKKPDLGERSVSDLIVEGIGEPG